MEFVFDLVLYLGILSPLFILLGVLTWFTENTRIGRRFMDWVMYKLGLED